MGNFTIIRDVNLSHTRPVAIVCAAEEEEIIDDKILGYTMIVSVIFLTATALIYGLLPELRSVIYGIQNFKQDIYHEYYLF